MNPSNQTNPSSQILKKLIEAFKDPELEFEKLVDQLIELINKRITDFTAGPHVFAELDKLRNLNPSPLDLRPGTQKRPWYVRLSQLIPLIKSMYRFR